MAELDEALATFATKAKRLLGKDGEVGEENTKAVLVEPMLQALGWDTHDLDEVQREFRYKPQDNPVDYALFVSARPRLFVEAKGLGRDLGQHKWRSQAVNYANTAGVEWCVLTDGNFWQVYKSNAPGDLEQKLFLETWLYNPDGRTAPYEPNYVLSLLARDKLVENAIETLWQVLNVDRRGRDALLAMVESKDRSLLRLIRKRAGLTQKQVDAFLSRAEVGVETPPITAKSSEGPGEGATLDSVVLHVRSKGVSARGRPTGDGFIVVAHSQAVAKAARHLKGTAVRLRAQLLQDGVLLPAGDHLEFTQNCTFGSPSLAAMVVLGRAANGWIEWRDEQGRNLGQLRQRPTALAAPARPAEPKPVRPSPQARRVPSQQTLEIPLLRAILGRGGEVRVKEQGAEIDAALAREFGVTREQQQAVLSDGKTTGWSNRIRWTRLRLVKRGDLDGSQRGLWRVTEQGRLRADQT